MSELEERRFLVSGAEGEAALAKIRQSLRVLVSVWVAEDRS